LSNEKSLYAAFLIIIFPLRESTRALCAVASLLSPVANARKTARVVVRWLTGDKDRE